jgi:hypothetical protein
MQIAADIAVDPSGFWRRALALLGFWAVSAVVIGFLHDRMRCERNFRPSHSMFPPVHSMFPPVHSQRAKLTLGCIRHSACRNTRIAKTHR